MRRWTDLELAILRRAATPLVDRSGYFLNGSPEFAAQERLASMGLIAWVDLERERDGHWLLTSFITDRGRLELRLQDAARVAGSR